jgi:hypothetical protein
MASSGVVAAKNCAGVVVCSSSFFELHRSVNTKWQFLECATIAVSERRVKLEYLDYNIH